RRRVLRGLPRRVLMPLWSRLSRGRSLGRRARRRVRSGARWYSLWRVRRNGPDRGGRRLGRTGLPGGRVGVRGRVYVRTGVLRRLRLRLKRRHGGCRVRIHWRRRWRGFERTYQGPRLRGILAHGWWGTAYAAITVIGRRRCVRGWRRRVKGR